MATTEKYTTVIELNSEQAKRNLDELRKKVEAWKSDLAEAKENKMGKSFIASIRKELREAEKELKKYDNEVARTIDTMNDLQSASVERIEQAQKSLRRIASEVPRDSSLYTSLNEQLDMVTQELENIKATKAFDQLNREAAGAAKSLQLTQSEAAFVKQTVENIDTASLKQLKMAEQTALQIKESTKQGTDEYKNAAESLDKIRGKLSDIDAQERRVVTVTEQYNRTMKSIGMEEKVVANETELIERTLRNLSTASVRDIEFSIKALKEQLQDIDRSDDEIEETTQKIKQLNEELRKVQDMQSSGKKKGLISIGADFLNKNWGAITQVIGGYNFVRDIIKGSVDDFAQMDQEMANVRKYTGQTSEEVARMNETFKRMDTRTSREELNRLAGAAGRLGITSTAAVEEFVDAADKINVALGDDLGDGAVDKIGKLAMAFGEDDKKGLRGAMLATGSVVNELAQNSSANAGYLVEFTARLAGVGVQAGLTQAQIMSFGAVMDENMQKDEMASTALSQIITKMTTDSATFARIAGKNVEEFSNLVRTDMNGALMEFFEAMNKKGGFTELAPLFEQMGLDGTRAIGVLSTLANKIGDVSKHQQLANEAYEKATSVIDEYNVQNNTYQAQLDKARNSFHDLRVELGERLLPVASVALGTSSLTARALKTLIDVVLSAKTTIMTLTVVITALTVAKNLDIIKTKLVVFWNNVLIGSLKKLRAALIANPWTAAVVGVTALIAVIADLTRKTDKAKESQSALADVEAQSAAKMKPLQDDIERLTKKIHDNSLSVDERRKAVEDLKAIVPGYVATISEEGKVYDENTAAVDRYIQKQKELAMVEAAKAKMQQLAEERLDLETQKYPIEQKLNRLKKFKKDNSIPDYTEGVEVMRGGGMYKTREYTEQYWAIQKTEKALKPLNDAIQKNIDAQNELDAVIKKQTKDINASSDVMSDGSGYDTRKFWESELKSRREKLRALRADAKTTAADIEKASQDVKEAESKMEAFTGARAGAKQQRIADKLRRERLKKADDAAKAETEQQLAELTHRYAMGRILYCDYIDEQERIQLEGIERRMLIYNTESLEYQRLSRQREELFLNGSEESRKLTLAGMKNDHEQRLAAIEEMAWRENMTEQQKNEMLFREDQRFLDSQRILYRQGTLERINLENEIEAGQQQHRLQQEQHYQQQLIEIREQYLNKPDTRAMDLALKNLDELHERGKLSEIEYQEALLAIKAQYANYETGSEHDRRVGSNMLRVAQDSAKQKLDDKGSSTSNVPIAGDIMLYRTTMEELKRLYGDDENAHAQYLAAKQQATAEFCESLAQKMQAAYSTVNQVMSAASGYFSAQQEYETAQVQRKYEKQIEAAGNNQKKVKKLQEKQQKEEAAIKTKYARKAAAIQMAQAVAQTAISAINAYSSAAAVPVVGHILAPIAAAAAIAAGMLQIATIKKQQQAQQSGYYEGGFTGGRRYRREAGVVHEGEFVANHRAVNNPAIMPFLQFIDQAQRNNTVGSLTAADVSRHVGVAAAPQVIAPVVNVQTDNSELRQSVEAQTEATNALLDRLSEPIEAQMSMQDFDRDYKRYQQLLKNK